MPGRLGDRLTECQHHRDQPFTQGAVFGRHRRRRYQAVESRCQQIVSAREVAIQGGPGHIGTTRDRIDGHCTGPTRAKQRGGGLQQPSPGTRRPRIGLVGDADHLLHPIRTAVRNAPARSDTRPRGDSADELRGPMPQHRDGGVRAAAGDGRQHRPVDHPQPVDAVHAALRGRRRPHGSPPRPIGALPHRCCDVDQAGLADFGCRTDHFASEIAAALAMRPRRRARCRSDARSSAALSGSAETSVTRPRARGRISATPMCGQSGCPGVPSPTIATKPPVYGRISMSSGVLSTTSSTGRPAATAQVGRQHPFRMVAAMPCRPAAGPPPPLRRPAASPRRRCRKA